VPKSTTLGDLEWPLRTLFQNMPVVGAHHKHLNDGHYQWQRCTCSVMTLVSGNLRFIQYLQGLNGKGASNDGGVVENSYFQ